MPHFMLAQAGRDGLTNFKFVLEAPWKACRLCGAVCQTEFDRQAYELHMTPVSVMYPHNHALCVLAESRGRDLREKWLIHHNKENHSDAELVAFAISGLEVTAVAAAKLSTYGIIHMSGSLTGTLDPDEDQALLEAPRAPIDDCETITFR